VIVVLDPGHGESTPGKRFTFADGSTAYEWKLVRRAAVVLKQILEDRGLNVGCTLPLGIEDPADIPLKQRVDHANRIKGAVLVSIHTNAGGGHGFEIYTSPGKTASDAIARDVEANVRGAGFHSRGVKEANFYVLRKSFGPAVLIELAFHDNAHDVAMLNDEDRLYDLCLAIANGLA
jgi:N-acetylmuramoyl-L-alanine amidase